MSHRSLALLSLGLALSCGGVEPEGPVASLASALSVVYTPDRDTWAYQIGANAWDYGRSRELRTNNILVDQVPKKIFLHFPINLAVVCPTLSAATLRLTSAQLAGPLQVHPHPVMAWVPGMTGAVAADGCVANSGAQAFFVMPAAGAPLPGVLVNQPCQQYTWDITPIVQDYCATGVNRGLMMAGRQGANPVNFFSRESPVNKPQLQISY